MREHRANLNPDDAPNPDQTYPQTIACDSCHLRVTRLAEAPQYGWTVYGDRGHCPDCPPLCHLCGEDLDDALLDGSIPATCSVCRGEG